MNLHAPDLDNQMHTNIPDLDALDQHGLAEFANRHHRGRNYKDLFPHGGVGTKNAAATLVRYASMKQSAAINRILGQHATADTIDTQCNQLYTELPVFAQWRKALTLTALNGLTCAQETDQIKK